MKVLRIIAVIIFSLYIINSIFDTNDKKDSQISAMTKYTTQLKKIFKNFNKVKERSKYTRSIVSNNGVEIGILYLEPYKDDKRQRGYNGKITLAVATDRQGEIQGVLIGENTETPSFMKYLSKNGFLRKWNMLSVEQVPAHKVDAVTGATFSSNAIAHGIKQLAIKHSNEPETIIAQADIFKLKDFLLLLWLFAMLRLITKRRDLSKYRKFILVSNVIVLGFLLQGLFSLELLGKMANGNFLQPGLLAGFVGILLYTWWSGKNIYCVWICPFGAMQTLLASLNKTNKIKFSPEWQKGFKFLRTLFFITVLVLLIVDMGNYFESVNPFSLFYLGFDFREPAVFVAFVFLSIGLFMNRPWCRCCCPVGELIDLGAHYSKRKILKKVRNYVKNNN